MTMAEMVKYMNRTGDLVAGDLTFAVTVTDVRNSYGRLQLQVQPVAGHGVKWVQRESVVLADR